MQVIYQIGEFVGLNIGRSPAYYAVSGLNKFGYLKKLVSLNTLESRMKKKIHVNLSGKMELYERAKANYTLKSIVTKRHINETIIPSLFDIYSAIFEVEECDIFHVWNNYGLLSLRKAKKFGVKVVVERASSYIVYANRLLEEEYSKWGVKYNSTPKISLYRQIKELLEADYILVPSEFARCSFLAYGFPEKKIVKIPFGVRLADSQRERTSYENHILNQFKKEEKFRVLYTGSLSLRKGVQYLLQAWKELSLNNAELILTGHVAPDFKDLFEALTKKISSIRYLGHLPNREALFELFNYCSLYVFPSLEEGLAMSMTEALAGGLPVIATFNSGATELIRDGAEGFIVPIRDVEAIKKKILYLYENEEERRKMARNAKLRAKEFTPEKYVNNLVAFYERILEDK